MEIHRTLEDVLISLNHTGKAIILIGARQVGKTTLLKHIVNTVSEEVLWLNCDIKNTRNTLEKSDLFELQVLLKNKTFLVVDEAQKVTNIGQTLKLITDNFPDIQVIATGSSSFDLRNKLDEPLTGRKFEYQLFPLSVTELIEHNGLINGKDNLKNCLIYGSYPDVVNHPERMKKTLMELTESYLYKDVLELEGIRKSSVVEKLLVALALQVGSEVSYNELGRTIGLDSKTVEKYVDILEKCYVIFKLPSFSRNIRTELTKSKKIYFWDNGVRNAILQNFAPIEFRQDEGALWENYFIAERMKYNHYEGKYVRSYFWRTTEKQEIDYIEEEDGALHLFELKWNPKKSNTKFPNLFIEKYQPQSTVVVTPENYLHYVL